MSAEKNPMGAPSKGLEAPEVASDADDRSTSTSNIEKEKLETSGTPESPQRSDGEDAVLDLKKLDSKVETSEKSPDPFAHLPEHEKEILHKQLYVPATKVGYVTLFRYATKMDLVILVVSAICIIAAGAAMPLMTVVFGGLTGMFADYFNGRSSFSTFEHQLTHLILYFVYLAVGEFVTTYIGTVGFIYVGEHCTKKIRENYLKSMLRQNIGFFDKLGSGEVTTRITADTNTIQDGISEKFGLTLNAIATFIAAFVIAYVRYAPLAAILTSAVVAITLSMATGSRYIVKCTARTQEEYARGGTVAEEVISSVRNATAFNTQEKLAKQYDTHLIEAEKWGRKLQYVLGSLMATMFCLIYLNYGLAFWQGSRFLVKGKIDVAQLMTVLFAIMIGAFSFGNIAPNAKSFMSAIAAGQKIFESIDRSSPIDPYSEEGIKLDSVIGTIELRDVKHIYPSRPEVTVMQGFNLVIPAGKNTALIGPSGSGKSSIVGLIERFYDPVGGEVLLDGHNINTLNIRWLREQIKVVQQEPVLFGCSIFENISYGLLGPQWKGLSEEKMKEMIIDAAKMSNAHDFITALPEGYETNVGERGFLLSGGQKQRIAIARAIVSNPRILLLDEATSALDSKAEEVVQDALYRVSVGRTVISIAHRLSTIRNADQIVVMSQDTRNVVEIGKHDELIDRKGVYYTLVEAQRIAATQDTGEAKVEPEEVEMRKQITDPDDVDPAKLERIGTQKSLSSIRLEKRKEEKAQKYSLGQLLKLVWSLNKQEWPVMAFGFFCSVIAGGGNPTQAVIYAKVIAAISLPPSQYGKLRHEVDFWAAMFLMLAGVQLLANLGHGMAFGYCSEKLIHRARDQAFRAMLRQEIGFYDKEENTSGALTAFLSTTATQLAGLSGTTLGTLCMVSTTLVAALIISLSIGWKLALVCMSTIPVLLGCGFFRFWMLSNFQRKSKAAYAASAGFACEATSAIRTIASLTREDDVLNRYGVQLETQRRKDLKSVLKSSLLYAASQSLVFLCVALGFWYGGTLIAKFEYTQFRFFVVFSSIIFGSQSAGSIFSFAPDMGKARHAAAELKDLLDRKPEIDTWSEEGEKLPQVEGHLEFRDVHFRYPTRPQQRVLTGLDMTVKPGQYVALVGASGCGKSTMIALTERFYDVLSGGIFLDGKNITSFNLKDYRSHIALVSQEPTLYQLTIRENIMMGTNRDVSEKEVEEVCRKANIYEFIMSLPDGFNTMCGNKGTLLSGGQKQRIAIARALIRQPKILLLDEATSALDSESERVVQAALDQAAKGRTTIAVAHRLSTIQRADNIFVLEAGKVVEAGNHSQLMAKKGRYAELVTMQSLEKA